MGEKIVPDSSILIEGKVSEYIANGKLDVSEIIIPHAVLDELQAQASRGQEVGFLGLEELKKIQALGESRGFPVRFIGDRPSFEDIKLARSGRIDALIIDVAKNEDCTLLTGDYVQSLVAQAKGVKVRHIAVEVKTTGLAFESLFSPDTLSIHLKQDVPPMAKMGKPGSFRLVKIKNETCPAEELEDIVKQIFEATRVSKAGFIEISRSGASVVQLGNYRIAVARPPFSDGLEVTVVRPIVKLRLEDYGLSKRLMERLREKAEGVIVAGPPGSGKSTFAASLAEFYTSQGKVVKTLESPRDLQVGPEITQYGPLEGDFEKSSEILLLVRPDYTVFDEIRKTKDFQVFADMRLAGVGMIGIVHASGPIDAIQRFMGRVELGMIPHTIDTIIFVKFGEIIKVYELSLIVKVPTGMIEADLARPVVEVRDFESGKLEYEIYTFGEENIIVPVQERTAPSGLRKLAADRILEEISKFDPDCEIELADENHATVRVQNNVIARLIGKDGANISRIEDKLGIRISVEPRTPTMGRPVRFDMKETGNSIVLTFQKETVGKTIQVFVGGQFLFTAIVGKKAQIKVTKKSELGKSLLRALVNREEISVML